MFKELEKYIQDNPKGYWFKNKIYGWGWFPVKWQGVVTILVFIVAIILNSIRFELTYDGSINSANRFLIETFGMVILLIIICFIKGEKPRWQWGLPKDENK